MRNSVTDYSNTIIYKIACKDPSIKDIYVGHTTNFVQRKHSHRQSCTNTKSSSYHCKLYKVIRENGGWDNWDMDTVAFFKCADHYEARTKEQEYFISLNATLNSIEPLPSSKPKEQVIQKTKIVETTQIHYCKACKLNFENVESFDSHQATSHINNNTTKDKLDLKFACVLCNYSTCRQSQYERHLLTNKHISETQRSKTIKSPSQSIYNCNCGISCNSRTSLWRHKNKCSQIKKSDTSNKDEIIKYLMKENEEFKNVILEIYKNNSGNNILFSK